MTILKLSLNIKSILKSQEIKKRNLLEKQIHMRKHHQRNYQTFKKFREMFKIIEMIVMKRMS